MSSARNLAAGLALAATLALTACGRRDATAPDAVGAARQVLLLANSTEPADLDPQTVTGRPESDIIRSLIEGLVTPDPQTLEPRPGQAASWEISPDGRVYTFHLRPDARWSNGEPVTARDFVRSWQRMLTPALASEYAYNLFLAEGAEAYFKGELKDFSQTGFQAPDERTVKITLRHPTGYFLSLLLHQSWWPVPIATVEKFGGLARKGSAWTRPGNYVGNGPFVLKEWRPNQYIAVTRSPTYWDRASVRLDEVRYFATENADTEERMFRTGQLQITRSLPLSKIDVYRAEHPEALHVDPFLSAAYMRVNVRRPQLADPRVRRALALAIDREGLCKKVLRGAKFPAANLTPPNTGGFTAQPVFTDDVAAARALLAEAGFPGGRGLPPIEALYPTSDNGRIIMEAVQEMWRKNLGIDVRLLNQEWKVYLDSLNTLNFDVAWSAWVGDYVDPMTFLDLMVTDGGNNRTGWGSADYDRLVAEVQALTDRGARFEKFQEMEAILGREAPLLPLYYYASVSARSPEVRGWYPTLLDVHPLNHVWLEKSLPGTR